MLLHPARQVDLVAPEETGAVADDRAPRSALTTAGMVGAGAVVAAVVAMRTWRWGKCVGW